MADDSKPVYTVTATAQGPEWLFKAELPGSELSHTVRSLDDMDWVAREVRTVIAAQLGSADDDFDLRFDTPAA